MKVETKDIKGPEIYYDENLKCYNLLDNETGVTYVNVYPIKFSPTPGIDYNSIIKREIMVTFNYDCVDYNVTLDLSEGDNYGTNK